MDEVFTQTRVIEFLKDIDAFSPAGQITGRELKTGRELLAEYILDSGGDPDFTMENLGCPEGYPPCSHVRGQPRQLARKVISSPFGWKNNANGKCRKACLQWFLDKAGRALHAAWQEEIPTG